MNFDFVLAAINWIFISVGCIWLLKIARIEDSRKEHFLGWRIDERGNYHEIKKGEKYWKRNI
jgi:hypothetical protein